MMLFTDSVKREIESLPEGNVNRIILEYLLHNAVGSESAKSWKLIERHLKKCNVMISKSSFQQGLLKQTREGDIFIGSNDHGRCCGYYIMNDMYDVQVMKDWYGKRIAIEQSRLDHLQFILSDMDWV